MAEMEFGGDGEASRAHDSRAHGEKIEDAIVKLPAEEFRELASWVTEREQGQWDAQMDAEAAAGRLDFLIEEAEQAERTGQLRDCPEE